MAIMILLLPSTAQATTTTKEIRYNKYAFAWFSSFNPGGCFETRTVLTFAKRYEKVTGGPATISILLVDLVVEIADHCRARSLVYGEAVPFTPIPAGMLLFGPQLSSATINGSVDACDFISGTCGPVTIDVTITAAGPRFTDHSIETWAEGTTEFTYKTTSKNQVSTAAGSVMFGGTEYALRLQQAHLAVFNERTIAVTP
jgi:hypothetical protein